METGCAERSCPRRLTGHGIPPSHPHPGNCVTPCLRCGKRMLIGSDGYGLRESAGENLVASSRMGPHGWEPRSHGVWEKATRFFFATNSVVTSLRRRRSQDRRSVLPNLRCQRCSLQKPQRLAPSLTAKQMAGMETCRTLIDELLSQPSVPNSRTPRRTFLTTPLEIDCVVKQFITNPDNSGDADSRGFISPVPRPSERC